MGASRLLLLVSICIIAANGCFFSVKTDHEQENIGGGSEATAASASGQFPHLAALRTQHGPAFCSAIILSPQFLLTAAHCTIGAHREANNIFAFVGSTSSRFGEMHRVVEIIRHPQFHANFFFYDAAILRVADGIKEAPGSIEFAKLPAEDIPDDARVTAHLAGWDVAQVMDIFSLIDITKYVYISSTRSALKQSNRYE